jgi:hydrogenase expression/formation protein HypE
MRGLLQGLILPTLGAGPPGGSHDAAVFEAGGARLAFTTDSYVVRPLEFPGGDIGTLAVNGTVNDLAMAGARPLCLSVGFILEEGLPMELLARITRSIRAAADAAGVAISTGDTKVVERGLADGLYVNTAGVGLVEHPPRIGPGGIRSGDAVLLSGDLGRHGMAIMSAREGLEFESEIESDTAPLAAPVLELIQEGISVHCLRDLTRGGLASALIELAEDAGLRMQIEHAAIPVRSDVQAACELLGLDPLFVANEGRFAAMIPAAEVDHAFEVLRRHPVTAGAVRIGTVGETGDPGVTLRSRIGVARLLQMPTGEQLPRIC